MKTQVSPYIYVALSTIVLWLLFDIYIWSAFGLSLSVYYTYKLVRDMGKTIPILDLMIVMAALQWIVGAYIEYNNDVTHYKYKMYVDEQTYMSYIVPAVFAFGIGINIFKNNFNLNEIGLRAATLLKSNPKLPYILIVVGLTAPFLVGLFPNSLRFIFFIIANIKYIGVIYLLFSGNSNRWLIFGIIFSLTAASSIASGMFHDLLLWAMLFFTFVTHILKMKMPLKIAVFIVGIITATTIQSVKHEYRAIVWGGKYSGNKVALFANLAINQWRTGGIVTPSSDEDVNVRLNQGWIISAILKHVPEKESYASGGTVIDAIYASIVPRIIDKNKPIAGGQENFRKYTGLELGEGTSMGISLAGEGYANFGRMGGVIFMFVWGLFISWFWKKLIDLSIYYPTLLIWSPILFLQVVKAETELVVVLNHLIKSAVLVFTLLWAIKKYIGIRI